MGTVIVAGAALLLLAQFRFPRSAAAPEAPAPLERLAARATYDELAAIMADVQARLSAGVVALKVRAAGEDARGDAWSHVFVPALRVGADLALARVGWDWSELELADGSPVTVVARDHVRGLVTVRVAPDPAAAQLWRSRGDLRTPAYVAVIEATRGGPMVRPLFLARTDPVTHPEWEQPLIALGGAAVAHPGALLFSLEGRFMGLAVPLEGGVAAAPSDALETAVASLAAGDVGWPGDIGVRFAPMTSRLVRATGAPTGAVVAAVDALGPSAGRLRVGDVVRSIAGGAVTSPDAARVALARAAVTAPVVLGVARGGQEMEIEVPLAAPAAPGNGRPLGLVTRVVEGVGLEIVRVQPRTAASAAGLRLGDVLTHLDGAD
ncbi:MAG TPA: PDZ domain-containing protein, partial [Vicinamibacteria bacterium]|nr:PDZ domain-containing protein [Vicinamibacteria bacterium]